MSHKRSLNEAMNITDTCSKRQRMEIGNDNDVKGLDENDIGNDENVLIKDQLVKSGEPIILNVGGVKYQTCLSTLTTNTDYFRKFFSGHFSLKPSRDGSYFIDRNGEYFKYILHYLRNNKLCIPDDSHLIDQLILEVDFYGLSSMKSVLLLRKSNSSILRQGEIEFLQSCFNEKYDDGQYANINLAKTSMIYCGHLYPPYKVIQGLDSLLFIISTFEDRFGLFVQPKFIWRDTTNGFLFDLNGRITGERFVYTMHHLVGGDSDEGLQMSDKGINVIWRNHDENSPIYQRWLEIRSKKNVMGDLVPNAEMREAVFNENDFDFPTIYSTEIKQIEIYRIQSSKN